eukprot:gene2080-2357_t
MADIQMKYKEVRASISWDPDMGMRGLKRKIAKVIVKDADVQFVLKDGRGEMLREIRSDVVVYMSVRGGRDRKEKRTKERPQKRDGKKDEDRVNGGDDIYWEDVGRMKLDLGPAVQGWLKEGEEEEATVVKYCVSDVKFVNNW